MSPSFIRSAIVGALVLAGPVGTAAAQVAEPVRADSSATRSLQQVSPSRSRVFSINPLGVPFEIVSVEFEGALQGAFSLAGNLSYFSAGDEYTRSSLELKGRLYPNEQAPRAFSVGFGLGAVNTREYVNEATERTLLDKTYPSIGVYVDYNWLLGRSDRFFVGAGLGAKRILGDSDEFEDAPFVYGSARFLIGVAF
jgi:hypothetical protein